MRRHRLNSSFAAVLALALVACGPSGGADDDDDDTGVDASVGDGGGTGGDGGGGTPDARPAPDGIVGCNPQNFTLQQAPPPEVYLVIDRSGSMNEPGAQMGQTKWDELNGAVDFVVTQFEASIHFGLLMYPSGGECSTSGPQVGVAPMNAGGVMSNLSATTPAGGTPTAAALLNAASSLADLGDPESPDFVILATDGGPNCNYFLDADPMCTCTYASSPELCCTSYPNACFFGNTCLDDTATLDVITDLRNSFAIDTFVIGLAGVDDYVDLLDAMAVAGGRPQMGGATDYFAAANQAELEAALEEIASSVISCVIDLGQAPMEPDEVRIFVDGVEIPRDPTDGWGYTDASNTEIELFGDSCDILRDGTEHTLTATFGCIID